ncbi:histidine phosphatase family protein [Butyrivibrio sp. NC3005]|uniref:histidine phosphatase family protein n=1 Tax=Butyrivibrio sp. NC3005 TaxID=1280685 RepID=UPI0004026088|nr:histidine phosphatase family protein [Butyrivibrio sp. NC3005]
MLDFYVIRHGETDYNRKMLTQGNIEVPLNECGRQQAKDARNEIEKLGLKFDYVLSSPLDRAIETAETISGTSRESENFEVIDELHEMEFGELDGLPFMEEPRMHLLNVCPEKYEPVEGGESFEDLFFRMNGVLKKLAVYEKKLDKSCNVLVATHGMAMRGMLSDIRGTGADKIWETIIGNCDMYHLQVNDGKWTELEKTLSHGDKHDPHYEE